VGPVVEAAVAVNQKEEDRAEALFDTSNFGGASVDIRIT
jgi:hypothetical protein